MPTYEEIDWLVRNCALKKLADFQVMKCTSKIEGFEDKFIYIPCAGLFDEDYATGLNPNYNGECMIWSSSLSGSFAFSHALYEGTSSSIFSRNVGLQIRPVADKD